MGNRVSTSVTPFSLEDLEAIARGSHINTATTATATPAAGTNAGASTYAPFDAVAADLAAALTSPPTGVAAARKTPTPTPSDGPSADGGASATAASNSTVHLRKENLRAEMELQFADVDTSLHALRCVPDFSRGRRLPLLGRPATSSSFTSPAAAAVTPKPAAGPAATSGRRGSRYSDPTGSASDVGLDVEEGTKAAAAAGAGTSGRGAAKRRASSVRGGTTTTSATTAAPVPSMLGSAESPRSWICRDVAVQPVDLTQAVDIGSSEVYVVVLVQRTSAVNSVAMSGGGAGPASAGHHSTVSASQSLPASGAGAAGAASGATSSALHGASSGGTRAGKSGRAPAAAAGSGNNTGTCTTPAVGQPGGGAEWPREMTRAFTPRGLSTPFSSDINRASFSGTFYPSTNAAGGYAWGSPTATPRTSGSASNRPTPRSGVTTAATGTGGCGGGGSASVSPGSPRSASSLATPRRSGFHYSIHLLTGTQADALTAAAGVLVARAIEKLFFECPDFDRRLFYHVNLPKAEETIRAYHLSVSPPEDAAHGSGGSVSAARGSSKASGMSDGAAAGGSTSLGKGIQRGLISGGGPLTSAAQSSAGVSQSSSSNTLAAAAVNGAVKGSSLFYLTAAQEAAKELLRELLAYMRPVPVVVPRFERVSSGSPASAGVSPISSTASPASVAFSSASPPAASFNADSPSPAVPSNMTELFGVNALFRVLSGVRLGTPRWPHAGDAVSPLNSARFAVSGGGATSSSGMSSSANNANANANASTPPSLSAGMSTWHHELLPSFRPPRRGLSIAAAAAAVAASTAAADPTHSHSANAGGSHGGVSPFTADLKLPLGSSIWLQGPTPLDVHSATAAGGAGGAAAAPVVSPNAPALPSPPLSSPASTTPRGGGRLPPTRPWSSGPDAKATKPLAGHPFSPTPAGNTGTFPQLPLLALGGSNSHGGGGGGGAGGPRSRRPAPLNAPPTVTQTASPSLVTTPQQLTTQPRFSLPLEALLPKRTAPTGASGVMPHAADAATYSAGAASGGAGRSGATAATDNNNNPAAADRLCPAKHVRPRSHQPSTKKGAEAAKAGSPLKKRRSQDQSATEPATSALSFSIDVPRSSNTEVEEDYNEVSNQQERAQRLKAAQPEVTEVLPYLFVGGETAARDRAQLLAKGITHIVNTVSWCLESFYPDAFHYFALSLSDAADEPIFSLFSVVNAFVERALSSASGAGGRVFIHCQQGVSRSCTFVIAYVMWKLGLCYDRAYELVRARRNVCSPNTGFLMNLRLWEAHLTTPQLNTIYAFAPYTAESPTPFVYQLASYYTCESDATTDAVATTQESRDHYYQLCADVLRRAVDHREGAAAAADKISLDPRLCHILLGAPRKAASTQQAAASTAAGASGTEDEDAAGRIEACLLVGPACTEEPYSQQAIAAYGDFVRCGFYHGEARTSIDNAGRVIRFAPLRTVHTNASPDALNPVTAAEAEALFARHVDGCCGIVYAAQPQWDALLGLPRLSARLARYAVEAQDTEAGESARHGVREAERDSARRGVRMSGSTTTATTPQPPSTASPVSASSQLFRTSRHTPRTAVTRPPSHTSSTKCAAETADAVAATPSPPPPFGSSSSSASPSLRTNSPGMQTERIRDGSGAALQLHMPHPAGLSALEGNGGASLTLDKGRDGQAARLSSQQCDNSAAAAATAPPQVARHAVRDCGVAAPHSLTTPAIGSHREVHASHVVADGGDSFAFMYPFDAASRVVIADLDDLEPDECYVVGFQQPSGVSVYLWRGAESPLEVQDVVDAFVRELLEAPSDAEGIEQLREAMANLEWAGCSLRVPVDGEAVAVLPHVRLLFVEQADEPEEFMTLL